MFIGINDSPALAQADVGLSLGTGAAIANEASDIVLVKGHVVDVCTALDLSRAIFRRIQWNFVWSLIYNCLGIPVAAGVFYPFLRVRLPPTVAALAMALSSVSVVMSSLLLRWYQPPSIELSSRQPRRQRRRPQRVVAVDSHSDAMMSERLLDHDFTEFTETTELVDNRTGRSGSE
jgi:magnesium-transporting ATPase (P-type)